MKITIKALVCIKLVLDSFNYIITIFDNLNLTVFNNSNSINEIFKVLKNVKMLIFGILTIAWLCAVRKCKNHLLHHIKTQSDHDYALITENSTKKLIILTFVSI